MPTRQRQQMGLAAVLIAPGVILVGLFIIFPMIQTLIWSFYRWDGYSPDKVFVGLGTYARVVNSLGFLPAVRNTALWAMLGAAIPPAIGLAAAALVEDSKIRFKPLFRLGFFLPYLFSMAVAAAIFARVYDPSYGMANRMLQVIGLGNIQPQWLGDQRLALASAIMVYIWHETAFCYIVFTAAIQQIDPDLYSAAAVDGASGIEIFRYITIPTLRNSITFVMTVMIIGGLTPFSVIFALDTRGGPYYATEVFPTLIHKKGLMGSNASEAAALGVILLVAVMVSVVLLSWLRERPAEEMNQ